MGDFSGWAERYQPVPWDALSYDLDKGGYVVALSREKLEGGPAYDQDGEPAFDDTYGQRISDYYGGLI
jgi:hypothetical protein